MERENKIIKTCKRSTTSIHKVISGLIIMLTQTAGIRNNYFGLPCGTVVKNLPTNAGDMGSSPGLGRSHMPWSN